MSYVGKMSDLIELYLAELERDGLDNVLGVGLPVVSGILTDFAQWLEDDVQDEKELNLTGFGDVVEDSLTVPQPGFYRCTKTVIMNEGFAEGQFQHQAFTAGKFYEGRPGDAHSVVFIDDTAQKHTAHGAWLYEHFEFAAEFNPD